LHEGFSAGALAGDLYANLIGEALSILITVFLIGWFTKHRATQQEKDRLVLQMGSPDNAFAREAVRQLQQREWGFGKDKALQSAHLSGANLEGADLREANLEGAHLNEAKLEKARLDDAKLQGASMMDTKLQRACLWQADLRGAILVRAKLQGVELIRADLQGASLLEARLQGADLSLAKLQGTCLSETNLYGVLNLRDEQLAQAKMLWGATMPDGSHYDGHFKLAGDIEAARKQGVDNDDPAAMADFYGVSLEEYERGQEWARENLARLRGEAGEDDDEG
jgi:hypothetical protein